MAEVLTPYDNWGRAMSPIEADTGVVLPIWAPGDGNTNKHHPRFLKRQYLNYHGPRKLEMRAVRHSRLHEVCVSAHKSYHDEFPGGTTFPTDSAQSFGIIILHGVRYIPDHVVDMTRAIPEVIETTPRMRSRLQEPGVMTAERRRSFRKEIGQFLMYHAITQDFDHVKQSLVEQFVELSQKQYERDELALERRHRIGMRLTNIGLSAAAEVISDTYSQARQLQILPEDAPPSPFQVVKSVVSGYEPDYYDELARNLEVQLAA